LKNQPSQKAKQISIKNVTQNTNLLFRLQSTSKNSTDFKKNLKINKSKQTYQNLKEKKKNLRCGGGVCVEPIHKIELTLYNIECVFYLQTTPTNNKKNNQDKKKIMFVFLSRR
jgi:hypothetical protein